MARTWERACGRVRLDTLSRISAEEERRRRCGYRASQTPSTVQDADLTVGQPSTSQTDCCTPPDHRVARASRRQPGHDPARDRRARRQQRPGAARRAAHTCPCAASGARIHSGRRGAQPGRTYPRCATRDSARHRSSAMGRRGVVAAGTRPTRWCPCSLLHHLSKLAQWCRHPGRLDGTDQTAGRRGRPPVCGSAGLRRAVRRRAARAFLRLVRLLGPFAAHRAPRGAEAWRLRRGISHSPRPSAGLRPASGNGLASRPR